MEENSTDQGLDVEEMAKFDEEDVITQVKFAIASLGDSV